MMGVTKLWKIQEEKLFEAEEDPRLTVLQENRPGHPARDPTEQIQERFWTYRPGGHHVFRTFVSYWSQTQFFSDMASFLLPLLMCLDPLELPVTLFDLFFLDLKNPKPGFMTLK